MTLLSFIDVAAMSDCVNYNGLIGTIKRINDPPVADSELVLAFELVLKGHKGDVFRVVRKPVYFVYDILSDGFIKTSQIFFCLLRKINCRGHVSLVQDAS